MTGEEEEEPKPSPPVFHLRSSLLKLRENFNKEDYMKASTLKLAQKAQELYPEYCTQKATVKGTNDDGNDDIGENQLKLSKVFNGSDMTIDKFVENITETSKIKIQDILFGR